jgi:aspartokinase/homoserine dehydrogenase 1
MHQPCRREYEKSSRLSGMFSTLGKNNVNIRAIAQGAERNISAINERDVKKALNVHENFLKKTQTTQLFVMGVGNVEKNS